MAIAAINSISLNSSYVANNKTTNPIEKKQPVVQEAKAQEQGSLRSYFLGAAQAFGGFPVSTSGFITKKIDDVPCCCCGGRMVRNSQMHTKAKEFSGIRGEALADKIEQDKDFFRTPQRVVMMLSAEEARKNPSMDLTQAKNAAGKGLKEKTQNYCINSLQTADAAVKAKYGEENPVSQLIASKVKSLNEGNIERMSFTEKLVKMQSQMDEETYETVIDAAMNIPQNFSEVRKAYGEARGNSTEIAQSLLKPSMQTIEHIHPKSMGGPNATQNFIAECADCNNPRGNMSYAQWLKVHPEYPFKAQDHIEYFQQQVVDGKIHDGYDDYGVDVKETLSKESNGIIELKVLNPETIVKMRNAKKMGKEADVKKEINRNEGQVSNKKEQLDNAEKIKKA